MKTKKPTLSQFTAQNGGQERTAAILGVAFSTLNRWLRRHAKPRGLSLQRLADMGIDTTEFEGGK